MLKKGFSPHRYQMQAKSLITSPAMISPATEGTNATLPGICRLPSGRASSEGNGVIAGSFSSFKYPTRAPEGTTLLRVFVGGARAPEMVELPRDELVGRVENEVCKLLGVKG